MRRSTLGLMGLCASGFRGLGWLGVLTSQVEGFGPWALGLRLEGLGG